MADKAQVESKPILTKDQHNKLLKILNNSPRKFRVLKFVVDEGLTWKDAMIAAGYTPNYALSADQLKGQPDMQEALSVLIEDWYTKLTHIKVLNASKIETWMFNTDEISDDVVDAMASEVSGELLYAYDEKIGRKKIRKYVVKIPDFKEQRQALDMLYKLTGAYAPEKVELSGELSNLSEEELEQLERENRLKIDRFKKYGKKPKLKKSK